MKKTRYRRNHIATYWFAVTVVTAFAYMVSPWAVAAGSATTVRSATRPSQPSKAKLKPTPQRVTFSTDDHPAVQLVATYLPPAPDQRSRRVPMVILLHAEGEDRTSFDPLTPALHAAGMAVLAVDLFGHGESVKPASLKLPLREKRDPKLFHDMTRDVEAAYRWLSQQPETDPARFVLVGMMTGGNIALEYAARDKSVDGVVCMSPRLGGQGLKPTASARKYVARKLLLLAGPDERVDAEALGRLVPGAEVKIVGDRSGEASTISKDFRGSRMLGESAVVGAIRDFLADTAGPSTTDPVVASIKGKTFYEPSGREATRLSPDNLRWFSSAAEAQARGYRPPKSRKK